MVPIILPSLSIIGETYIIRFKLSVNTNKSVQDALPVKALLIGEARYAYRDAFAVLFAEYTGVPLASDTKTSA